jgi:fumarylacetoacetate (FAA) hydrolase
LRAFEPAARATDAFIVVPTLQQALDDWERYAPALAALAEQLGRRGRA